MERVPVRRFVEAPGRAPLTNHQRTVLALYAKLGSVKAVAATLGISHQAAKDALARARRNLGVDSTIQAYVVLGWLRVP